MGCKSLSHIVRVALGALFIVLIDPSANFKATLEYFTALLVVVFFLVKRYWNLTIGKQVNQLLKYESSLYYWSSDPISPIHTRLPERVSGFFWMLTEIN